MSKKHPAPSAAPINPAPEEIAAVSAPDNAGAPSGESIHDTVVTPAAPLPEAVVPPEEQVELPPETAPLESPAPLPEIPSDAMLAVMDEGDLFHLAKAHGAPGESREADIVFLQRKRDGVETKAVEHPSDDWSPSNPGEFGPSVVLLHLERDGVIVEGPINPYTGTGTEDLMIALQDRLAQARAKPEGAAPAAETVASIDQPDPQALKRQPATAAGHDIDPETKRCHNCHNAEWWCLDGNPCVERQMDAGGGETPIPPS